MNKSIDTAHWLADPELDRLMAVLEPLGEIRFIGGAVRDALLNMPHSDIDLATTALPGDVLKAGVAAGFRMVPTGIDHGTVTAVLARGPVEITTLRRDVATDGRHAEVAFTDDWKIDAARRDFTINALSAGRDGALHDYFGGMEDLVARRVRFIGDAASRIGEDYLRILRFFRFSGRYATSLDQDALLAIRDNLSGVAGLSGERILSELLKLLSGPRSAEMWEAMIECGLVKAILPAATNVRRLRKLTGAEPQPDALLRLMALLPTPVTNVPAIAKKLKLSAAQRKRMAWGALPEDRIAFLNAGDWPHALYGVDLRSVIDAAMLLTGSEEFSLSKLKKFMEFAASWTPPEFPLGGNSLKELGLKPGPIFGALLRETEAWWVAQDFTPTRQQCFAELKRIWFEKKQASI